LSIKTDLIIYNLSEIVSLPQVVRGFAKEKDLGIIYDGFIAIKDGKIFYVGERKDLYKFDASLKIDAENSIAIPGLIDPHTHLIYAGAREDEYEMILSGAEYNEILSRGGGITRTMRETSKTSLDMLVKETVKRIYEFVKSGVTTIEIKTGYGIDIDSELKLVRALEIVRRDVEIDVIPTLLAHVIPPGFERKEFIDRFVSTLIPEAVKKDFLFIDVFCDSGAFNVDESRKILSNGVSAGLKARIHADELAYIKCSDLGLEIGSVSIDHLNNTPRKVLEKIAKSDIVAILSPTTSIYIAKKMPDVYTLLRNNGIIALTTDHSPALMNLDMIETMNLASIYFSLPPANIVAATTVNAAYSLRAEKIGSIKEGFQADLVILNVKSYRYIGYLRKRDLIKYVIKRGKILYRSSNQKL